MAFYIGPKRVSGPDNEQPYLLGPLKMRLPFVNYPLEIPDFLQGAILSVVPLGVTAAMTSVLGIPFELAVTMVIINNFLYLVHTTFGDPSVVGWITPGIPLYIAFLSGFPEGPQRIQAMIALQLTVAVIFLVMGAFRIANSVVSRVPTSMKAGILLGAGVASLIGEFQLKTGRIAQFPLSIILGGIFAFFMLFSSSTKPLRERYGWFRFVATYGIAFPFALSYALGIIIGEIKAPQILWSLTPFPFGQVVKQFSVFAVGFPPFEYFMMAAPLAITAYIIAFGDILVVTSLLKTADEARKDEKIVFDANRNNVIVAIRNFFESMFMPYLPLAGPQWTAGQALVVNRYINSTREQEDSYWGGATSIFWGMSIALCLGPVVTLFKPGVAIGLSLTLLVQGFLCCYLAMEMMENNTQRGIAGVMGAVLAIRGAAWGLATGLILYLLVERKWVKEEQKVKVAGKSVSS